MNRTLPVFVVGALALLGSTAHAQGRAFPPIGPDIGYSYFLDSKTRSVFGSSATEYGIGFGKTTPSLGGRVGLDLSIVRPKQDTVTGENKALVIFAGPQLARIVGVKTVNDLTGVVPYYGASLNAIYAQVETPFSGSNGNGYGAGASVFAGASFNRRLFLEGRLRAATKIESYSFSTASLTLGIRF